MAIHPFIILPSIHPSIQLLSWETRWVLKMSLLWPLFLVRTKSIFHCPSDCHFTRGSWRHRFISADKMKDKRSKTLWGAAAQSMWINEWLFQNEAFPSWVTHRTHGVRQGSLLLHESGHTHTHTWRHFTVPSDFSIQPSIFFVEKQITVSHLKAMLSHATVMSLSDRTWLDKTKFYKFGVKHPKSNSCRRQSPKTRPMVVSVMTMKQMASSALQPAFLNHSSEMMFQTKGKN